MDSVNNSKPGKEIKATANVVTRSKSAIKPIKEKIPSGIKWLDYLPQEFVSFTNYNPAHQLLEMLAIINKDTALDDNYLVVNEKEARVNFGAAKDSVFV